ncbi:unnamed protein product [Acanthoscelides obtectus]|uniref:Uncharacterized protein n=1 Tax=Acanthoscelides obtectus TaxID=200917 RepID=A0A9P0P8G3_ACAOB|nr:unnamed protein product [Acanthoscelides obtectus]CAK1627695.1 hypothetical protein AOBTE_LOCUS4772 [Acanthoscelides obtectus]
MTLYWWMHWFWITYLTFMISGENITILHSISTDCLPSYENSTPNVTTKASILCPSSTVYPKPPEKSTIPPKKLIFKSVLPPIKKANISSVIKFNTSSYDSNSTALFISNQTDNITYIEGESKSNQSLLRLADLTGVENETVSNGTLSAAGITGITLGCVIIVGVLSGISYFIYRNRSLNQPQVLNDRCSNPDSSGYIDDASVRDNSEEMYSLDNDSFLNSLEAMTIQNYWTDTVKHTKL